MQIDSFIVSLLSDIQWLKQDILINNFSELYNPESMCVQEVDPIGCPES